MLKSGYLKVSTSRNVNEAALFLLILAGIFITGGCSKPTEAIRNSVNASAELNSKVEEFEREYSVLQESALNYKKLKQSHSTQLETIELQSSELSKLNDEYQKAILEEEQLQTEVSRYIKKPQWGNSNYHDPEVIYDDATKAIYKERYMVAGPLLLEYAHHGEVSAKYRLLGLILAGECYMKESRKKEVVWILNKISTDFGNTSDSSENAIDVFTRYIGRETFLESLKVSHELNDASEKKTTLAYRKETVEKRLQQAVNTVSEIEDSIETAERDNASSFSQTNRLQREIENRLPLYSQQARWLRDYVHGSRRNELQQESRRFDSNLSKARGILSYDLKPYQIR